ncbi:hypothetical protein PALA47_04412 [Pseudomonas aeruginosa]|nr:hypothetical protein PALA7_04413 [Pseudomonas aeruginosa]WBJ66533.1 hypothetical protein PALA47_04412 [Pseudomonas aeruginosa]
MLLVFGLNLLAFTALCLAMNRHHKNLLGHEPSASRVLLLRGVALLDLGLALAFSIHRQGVEIGIVFWSCLLMLAAGTLVLLLAWRPRWALPCAAGAGCWRCCAEGRAAHPCLGGGPVQRLCWWSCFPPEVCAMHTPASNTVASVIPCLRYRDAPAAIDWLCRTFGFQRKLVVPGEDGQVLHAELTYASPNGANGMLMLGSSVRDNAYGRLMRHVDEAGGNTQSLYLVVADPDALFRSAQAAGAEIVIDIKDEDYGGRGFTCRDPEGHVWSFGSYDPWA